MPPENDDDDAKLDPWMWAVIVVGGLVSTAVAYLVIRAVAG